MIDFKYIFEKSFIKYLPGETQVYVVGGAVRDAIMNKPPKDIDIVICGMPIEALISHLEKFGKVYLVGESFGVLKFTNASDDMEFDIALPRKDTKKPEEKGHRSIETQSDHTLSILDDLGRRDFTMNAIAVDERNKLVDPFNGLLHIYNGEIYAVSNKVFVDDPLRMIRALQFAARFEFEVDDRLGDLIIENAHLIKEIKPERVLEEFKKVFEKNGNAEYFLQLLHRSGLWENYFGQMISYKLRIYDNLAGFLFSAASNQPEVAYFYRNKLSTSRGLHLQIEAYEIWFNQIATEENPRPWNAFQALRKSQIVAEHIFEEFPALPTDYNRLQIDGDDLLTLGFSGKEIGDSLKAAIIAVAYESIPNEYDSLKEFVLARKEAVNL